VCLHDHADSSTDNRFIVPPPSSPLPIRHPSYKVRVSERRAQISRSITHRAFVEVPIHYHRRSAAVLYDLDSAPLPRRRVPGFPQDMWVTTDEAVASPETEGMAPAGRAP